jgi:hypothetical protein
MPWTCRIVSSHSEAKTPGDMWEVDAEHWGKPGWCVLLPDGSDFHIQGNSSDGTPWDVTGEAPNFTVSPSINRHGITHKDGFVWRKEKTASYRMIARVERTRKRTCMMYGDEIGSS